ncbi:N-acetylglucosaminyl-diphospho-decaprenol L-rhamnosyltransferase [Frondihabitans sp. 762G35]|uniref:glycosyltransferase family 2 protein n=1 Tax=Frondihabitans sp. 762G35 TaxID=1446794 RepID=UPI000D220971|nr:glycosyltransferase family 2 protein [Frondihabitans sp. 762G35]ARC57717.1 N-acetylglucosaminyl-diphospho-decaprenol L-rhamnosyltransferase [Frondihabitans sp. 762G35]
MEGPRSTAVIVVNYGSSALLRSNLAPLSRARPGLLVVVVDNFTDEREAAALGALGRAEGWEVVLSPENVGFGAGMNLGAARALERGAGTLVLLNPDALLSPEALDALAGEVEREPSVMVAPRILRPDGSVWFEGSDLYLDDGRIRSRRRRIEGARVEEWLSGACVALSAELWKRCGGFDEEYFLYWEDVDLSRRVTRAGGALRVASDVDVVHAEGGTQGDGAEETGQAKSSTYYYYNIRNRMLFAARHLDDDAVRRWSRQALPIAWEVLLQGGRRQLVTTPSTLLVALRAVRDGRRIAREGLRRTN